MTLQEQLRALIAKSEATLAAIDDYNKVNKTHLVGRDFFQLGIEIARARVTLDQQPKIADGTADAALAIGEHAFRAGFDAGADWGAGSGTTEQWSAAADAWSEYDPPENIKDLA